MDGKYEKKLSINIIQVINRQEVYSNEPICPLCEDA